MKKIFIGIAALAVVAVAGVAIARRAGVVW